MTPNRGMRIAERRIAGGDAGMLRRRDLTRSRGITLVELLIAIAIISILATILLGVGSVAAETAREARTKALISRLHSLVIERYDGYRNRRVEVRNFSDPGVAYSLLNNQTRMNVTQPAMTGPNDIRFTAALRLAAQRELMKLEMPDRWSDILGVGVPASLGSVTPAPARFLEREPLLRSIYLRVYNDIATAGTVSGETLVANQGAEMLYLIVMNATADGEGRRLFKEGDIDDTDGDGAPEFVDGWGNPISFLRWAPGFDSDAQLNLASIERLYARTEGGDNEKQAAVVNALNADKEPYDLFRLDAPIDDECNPGSDFSGVRGWRLTPLIYSLGGDEEAGIEELPNAVAALNPYQADVGGVWMGQLIAGSEAYADNLHNHALATLTRAN